MNLPSVTFVIPTFNSAKTIYDTFSSIQSQDYPRIKIEIIIGDGGSTDKTYFLAKKFGAKIVKISGDKQGAEYNRAIAAQKAKNDILIFLDHDNTLPHARWLCKVIQPFLDDEKIIGVETIHYGYNPKDSVLGRYFSLLGANDAVPFYLGKADRLSYMFTHLQQYGVFKQAKIVDRGTYFKVTFTKDAIPTLGSNGFLIRRSILFAHANCKPDYFFHIDVNVDLIRKGYATYGFVKDVVIHNTDERGIINFLRRRKLFVDKYHLAKIDNRRYSVYEKKDIWKLIYFIIIALTVIKPTIDALKGYRRIRDTAWFIHPIMTFAICLVYGYTIMKSSLISYEKKHA